MNQILDEMLFFISKKENRFIISKGREEFDVKDEFSVPKGFFEWLVHDFIVEDRLIIDILKENMEINQNVYDGIINSYISVFDVIKTKNNTILKDIFTGNDFKILEDLRFESEGIILTRVYPYKDGYIVLENDTYDNSFKSIFKKIILEKYNQYCSMYEPIDIECFLKDKSLLIYKFYEVIEDVIEKENDYDEFSLYQSLYMIQDKEKVNSILKKSDLIEFDEEYQNESVYKVYDENKHNIIAEIVVTNNKLELECANKDYLDRCNELIDSILGVNVAHVKNEVLSIDDIL